MFKNRLLINVFSSGLQAIAVQVLGGVFFYFISIYLSKESFGIISWMNALCLFITTLLGFGLEQVVVRRISVSKRSDWAAAAFFIHSSAGFLITFLLLLLLKVFIKDHMGIYRVLPWFFAAQGLIYMGVPLKQFLNAKEQFAPYGIIAVISNTCKIGAAYVLLRLNQLNIDSALVILITSGAFELCCLLIYINTKTEFRFKLRLRAYRKLLKEASAQYLSIIFNMSLLRMDWILLGLLATKVALADYSFAYRAVELARLPVFIMAPMILPRISRMMAITNRRSESCRQEIRSFNIVEMCFAMLIPMVLNILWIPLITFITKGKYGDSNSLQFLILSLCIPLQFFINLLWSLSFGAKKYLSITAIIICCAVTNLALNLLLITRFGGTGAAMACLITDLLQCGLFYRLVYKKIIIISLRPLILFMVWAMAIYLACMSLHVHFFVQLLIAVTTYLLVSGLSKQIGRQHFNDFRQFLSR